MSVRTLLPLSICLGLAPCLASCGERERPLPAEPTDEVALEVGVVSPSGDDILIAGRTVPVLVRAREPGGRVYGLGFVARRSGGDPTALDSALVTFGPVADTVIDFPLRLPSAMPPSSQVDIYGIVIGPSARSMLSAPRHVMVLVCPPNAAWC